MLFFSICCRYFATSRRNSPEAASATTEGSTRTAVLQHGNYIYTTFQYIFENEQRKHYYANSHLRVEEGQATVTQCGERTSVVDYVAVPRQFRNIMNVTKMIAKRSKHHCCNYEP